jgi:methyl-accepting chemotaxis protein
VEQVNKAVAEMNNITQQNAANAEESASASEELSAQAEQMKGFIQELTAIVGGSGNSAGNEPGRLEGRLRLPGTTVSVHQAIGRPAPEKNLLNHHQRGRALTPEQIIPMEEGDGKDF